MGAVEFARAAFVHGSFAPTLAGWLWLAGSSACAIIGVALVGREIVDYRGGKAARKHD